MSSSEQIITSASSEQTFNSSEQTSDIISASTASQYQKHLRDGKNRYGQKLSAWEIAFRQRKLKEYGQSLVPKNKRKFEERMNDIEAKMAAEADRVIENNDKNHSEAMGSMEDIKTMVMETELSILEHMEQRMMPLPNQVDLLGILLQKTLSA